MGILAPQPAKWKRPGERHIRRSAVTSSTIPLMVDGIELRGRTNVVALGITTDGVKIPLGLWDGSTENTVDRDRAADLDS